MNGFTNTNTLTKINPRVVSQHYWNVTFSCDTSHQFEIFHDLKTAYLPTLTPTTDLRSVWHDDVVNAHLEEVKRWSNDWLLSVGWTGSDKHSCNRKQLCLYICHFITTHTHINTWAHERVFVQKMFLIFLRFCKKTQLSPTHTHTSPVEKQPLHSWSISL